MLDYQRVDVRRTGDVTVAAPFDRDVVDEITLREIGEEVLHLIEQEGCRKLVLNFAAVEFLSSAALGKLLTLERAMRTAGGEIKLSDLRPDIREIFLITQLDSLFDIKATEGEALSAFT